MELRQGIAEHLVEPSADLLGSSECLAFLDRRQNPQELGAANVVDRHLPQGGQCASIGASKTLAVGGFPWHSLE